MKKGVEYKIRSLASKDVCSFAPKFNLAVYREGGKLHNQYVAMQHHKEVCEEITAFLDAHSQMPIYFVLQTGISKGAYKTAAFNKGYKYFDAEKVLRIHEFGEKYMKHNGITDQQLGDVGIRLMMRFYEKVSSDIDVFEKALKRSQVFGGAACMDRTLPYEVLCENLGIPYHGEGRNGNVA